MSRVAAVDRAGRLLAMVPWVASQDGVAIDVICDRFSLTREELLADLGVLWFVGTPPYSPADLIEVDIEDDKVWIRYAQPFPDRLRLTPDQALALLTAGHSLLGVEGAESDGPLARALEKLGDALGVRGRVAADLGPISAGLLEMLADSAARRAVLSIDYYSHARDDRTLREIEPGRLFIDQGSWYLDAWCRMAGGERTFRVDRIHRAAPRGELAQVRESIDPSIPSALPPFSAKSRVELEVTEEGLRRLENIPFETVSGFVGGVCRVAISSVADPWLERILLRLGREARVVDGPKARRQEAATRILEVYRRE